jgi:hypothetical protein
MLNVCACECRAGLPWEGGRENAQPDAEATYRDTESLDGAVDRCWRDFRKLRERRLWEERGLVFANSVGRPLEPSNLRRRFFLPLLERAGWRRCASTTSATPWPPC